MKPFNLDLAKQGHPVCTRDGRPARIVCFDRKGIKYEKPYPILALVDGEEQEEVIAYYEDGSSAYGAQIDDLCMAKVKKTGWVNIYDDGGGHYTTGNTIYDSEQEADEAAFGAQTKIDTIQIEFEV